MLDRSCFGLYAASARFPTMLARDVAIEETGRPGIFDIPAFDRHIRLVVLGQIDRHPRNAVWQLFSANAELMRSGARAYRPHDHRVLTLLRKLHDAYCLEDPDMPYTLEQFLDEARVEIVSDMSPEERRQFFANLAADFIRDALTPELALECLTREDRLRGLAPEERLKGLSEEELRQLRDHLNKLN